MSTLGNSVLKIGIPKICPKMLLVHDLWNPKSHMTYWAEARKAYFGLLSNLAFHGKPHYPYFAATGNFSLHIENHTLLLLLAMSLQSSICNSYYIWTSPWKVLKEFWTILKASWKILKDFERKFKTFQRLWKQAQRFMFLATLVALHFTPVSESVSRW